MGVFLQVFYSAFSSILLSLAIPNEVFLLGFPLCTLLSLIPFYRAISLCKNSKSAVLAGFTQTFLTHIFSSFWLAYFKDFAAFTLGASALGTGAIGGIFGLFFYLPYDSEKKRNLLLSSSLFKGITGTKSFKILYFAGIYTLYEWIKSTGYLGYPWGTLPSALYRWNLITQIAAITGTYGITFLISALNAALSERIFSSTSFKTFRLNPAEKVILSLLALSLVYGKFQLSKKRIPEKYLSTIMVQQNSDPWKEKRDLNSILTSERLTEEKLSELKNLGKQADLIVWSEGCLKTSFPYGEKIYSIYPAKNPLTEFIKKTETPFLAGGKYVRNEEKEEICNAALMFDKNGNLRGWYGKNHLVPFAEALPGREFPAVRKFLKEKLRISAGWAPGDTYVLFDVPAQWNKNRLLPPSHYVDLSKDLEKQREEEKAPPLVRFSTPICFDDAFPDVMSPLFDFGSELFVNITDDSWSLKKSSELQHFVIASYSSIEYRTTMLRSSNSGYSAVISPTGKILADAPLFEEYALHFDVPVYKRERTVYSRFGNWLPHLILLFLSLYCLTEALTFCKSDYIPSERKLKKKGKKGRKGGKKKCKKKDKK